MEKAVLKDDKDWTWVLEQPCPECGFDTTRLAPRDIGGRLLTAASDVQAALRRPDVAVRPAPGVWSPLEYACHVRDVFRIFDERLQLMLGADAPSFPNWDQDETAVADRYGEQDPAEVAQALGQNAHVVAARFDAVDGPDWERTGRRSDGASFSVASLGRYLVHDPVHHVFDMTGVQQA
jgi:hypothetical protein